MRKILLTGATGYIGQRLLPVLIESGYHVICCVRDKNRFNFSKEYENQIEVIELDFLNPESLSAIPDEIDIAYYLIHSMSATTGDFEQLEAQSAINFRNRINETQAKQVIYLSGIVNEDNLSKHLVSRKKVEEILGDGKYHLTTLRAGIIVGSGSASFEIIRDLVEKLPVMVAPQWLETRTQPIGVRNVLQFLKGVLGYEYSYDRSFDVGGPDILTYKEMLLQFAKVRGLKRYIWTVPVMTPKLSSYWLYFVTSTTYKLAANLVESMKIEVVATKNDLAERLEIDLMNYQEAVQLAFERIVEEHVPSRWTDAQSSELLSKGISKLIEVPKYGCFRDERIQKIQNEKAALNNIWTIGGENGWYYANWLWNLRGFIDKLFGGVGLRRGRKSPTEITAGESLDFWRVLYANKSERRLLLYAEMKLPGEAWLEFRIKDSKLIQTATFRPLGIMGRLYWYSVLPFHGFIFNGMARRIANN